MIPKPDDSLLAAEGHYLRTRLTMRGDTVRQHVHTDDVAQTYTNALIAALEAKGGHANLEGIAHRILVDIYDAIASARLTQAKTHIGQRPNDLGQSATFH